MKRTIQTQFKGRLLKIREDLGAEMAQLSNTILSDGRPCGEHDGYVSESIDKELVLELAEQGLCDAVDEALDRMARGAYGTCIDCGRQIAKARLAAVPYTAYCIRCENAREKNSPEVRRVSMRSPRGEIFARS